MNETRSRTDPILQAEVGGGARIDPGQGLQRLGYVIRDFTLESTEGRRIQISDYRGRANLVLVFLENSATNCRFLQEVANKSQEFTQEEATVVAIVPYAPEKTERGSTWYQVALVLVDEDASVHRLFGAIDEHGTPATVLYITDRFGEIVSVHPALSGQELPSAENVLKTLEFINHQCPECEPPEWPR